MNSGISRTLALVVPASAGGILPAPPMARAQDTGTLTTLYNFTGNSDGFYPNALVQGRDGNFYGTTSTFLDEDIGGPNGTVFQLTPAGVLTTLYSFTGGSDGGRPEAALIQGRDGNFYGTTIQGGDTDFGVAFRITPTGQYTRLYSFSQADGFGPRAPLVQGSDGNFYGPTYGGSTLFQLTPAGVLTILHSFGQNDAASPLAAPVQGSDGNFYGTAIGGNGTVFRITPTGEFTTLYSFGGDSGSDPLGGLLLGRDGNFYGTTTLGGGSANGTVFQLTPAGVLTTLYRFTDSDDGFVRAGLVQGSDGNFYGMTYEDSPSYQPEAISPPGRCTSSPRQAG